MKFTVINVTMVDDEKGKRLLFDFGSKEEKVLHTQVFMLDDKTKALKSTSIWTKNLLPDAKVPNVKGLVAFDKISEEEAETQILDTHVEMLKGLKDQEIDIYVDTNFVNGIRYTNWVPYQPTAVATATATEASLDDSKIDEITKEGF